MVKKSLLYPMTVLWTAGLGLLFFHSFTLELLQNDTDFQPMLIRFMGMFVVGLASFVSLTYRFGLAQLYVWTIFIRLFFLAALMALFAVYKNMLFGVVIVILVVGIGFTLLAYQFEKNEV